MSSCSNHCCGSSTDNNTNSQQSELTQPSWWKKWGAISTALVLAMLAEGVSYGGTEKLSWLVLLLAVAAIAISGIGTYLAGFKALFKLNLNMNVLMTIAVTGAMILGSWPEAAMVMVLFTLAERIEEMSLARAKNAISSLLGQAPTSATVRMPSGDWQEIPAQTIEINDVLRIKPGDRLAVDGIIIKGNPAINQAALTGESIPVDKAIGDTVFAGTLNQNGEFEMQVSASAKNSLIARIAKEVEEASNSRSATTRFIDKFAKIYTPIVFFIAIGVALFGPLVLAEPWMVWIYRALVLLVIACPCALVISTPVTIVSGLTNAARRGILIKGGQFLEMGRSLKILALDKTGTLTTGRPEVVALTSLNPDEKMTIQLAQALAVRSDHPLSKAIAAFCHKKNNLQDLLEVTNFTALPGKGVQGTINSVKYALANIALMRDWGIHSTEVEHNLKQLETNGHSITMLLSEREVVGIFALADTIKESSKQAIASLTNLGINTLVLSGDGQNQVDHVAKQLGIQKATGNLLPSDKLSVIDALVKRQEAEKSPSQQGYVGMVGDGINDTPALAKSHIGFAMGALGSDAAIETSDVAIMDDDLSKIAAFVQLSKQTRSILWQNIGFAIVIKLLFFSLTLLGSTNMWEAVFADTGVSIIVIANALRLLHKTQT